MDRLKNKVAVVTGGGAGIGKATCELFAEQGAAVVVAEKDEVSGRGVAESIVSQGGRACFVETDVSSEASIQAMAVAADAAFGRLDILVNNAAVFVLKGIDASVEDWRTILDINVVGPALCADHATWRWRGDRQSGLDLERDCSAADGDLQRDQSCDRKYDAVYGHGSCGGQHSGERCRAGIGLDSDCPAADNGSRAGPKRGGC